MKKLTLSGNYVVNKDRKAGKGVLKHLWKNRMLILMCLPAIVICFVFCYMPMPGIYVAFVNFNIKDGIFGSKFIGLKNFEYLFKSGQLGTLVRNAILYNVVNTVLGVIMQVSVAILLTEVQSRFFKKVSQTIMFIPYFISYVLVGLFSYNLFNYDTGVINSFLRGIGTEPFSFYNTPWVWPIILVAFVIWKGTGHGSIVYFAALCGVDSEILEAARIDGASAWKCIRHIKLPMLRPTIVILLLMSIGGMLRGNFGLVYNVIGTSNSKLWPLTDNIEFFVYRALLDGFNFPMGSATGAVQSVFGFFLVLLGNWIAKKIDPDFALF